MDDKKTSKVKKELIFIIYIVIAEDLSIKIERNFFIIKFN